MVADINAAMAALGSGFAGDSDPAAFAGPFTRWADTANGRWKIRNAAGTAWIDLGPLFQEGEDPVDGALFASQAWVDKRLAALGLDLQSLRWLGTPLRVPIPIWDHITGVTLPPTDDPRFRYIKLTADDAYNDGVLTDESVTGSLPDITATAVIDDEDSPLHGQTVALINTERAFVRPGWSSGVRVQDTMQGHIHRSVIANSIAGSLNTGGSANPWYGGKSSPIENTSGPFSDGTNGTPRVGVETQPVHRTATFYMRTR